MSGEVPRLRDEHGNRLPDDVEREAIRRAAERDGSGLSFRGETPRDWFYRAAGVEPRKWVDGQAVEAELRSLAQAGKPAGGDVKAQLEAMHVYGNIVALDFTRQEYDPASGEYRTTTDHNKLHQFTERLRMEAAARSMGPGSGMAIWSAEGWVGDPVVVARVRAAEEERAAAQAAQEARTDEAAKRFAGPYNIFGSVR